MQMHSSGIDLGKTTFHLVALGVAGKMLVRRKFTWKQLLACTANMQDSLIGLEACSGAHFSYRSTRRRTTEMLDGKRLFGLLDGSDPSGGGPTAGCGPVGSSVRGNAEPGSTVRCNSI
jgi:hypothetical protein